MAWSATATSIIIGGVVWGNITTIIVTVFMTWTTVLLVMYATVRNVAWSGAENNNGGIIQHHIINIHIIQITVLVILVQQT